MLVLNFFIFVFNFLFLFRFVLSSLLTRYRRFKIIVKDIKEYIIFYIIHFRIESNTLYIFEENEKGKGEEEKERMETEIGETSGDGRRGVPTAIIRVNYRAVSPFGELLIPTVGQLRSLERSSLNPVANLYHDRAPYRRTNTSESIETAERWNLHVARVQRCRRRRRSSPNTPLISLTGWRAAAHLALFPAGVRAYFANVLRIPMGRDTERQWNFRRVKSRSVNNVTLLRKKVGRAIFLPRSLNVIFTSEMYVPFD